MINFEIRYKILEILEKMEKYDLKDLFNAVYKKDLDKVKLILKKEPDFIDSIDVDEWQIVHKCAACGTPEIMRFLLENTKVDIHARTAYFYTPAHCAANYNNIECLKILVEYGANLSLTDRGGTSVRDLLKGTDYESELLQKRDELIMNKFKIILEEIEQVKKLIFEQ